ncbi:hypothetical protein AXF42_Ash001696 [Apostasia shenzhenica]|uniref:Uncharacterized protein n=1 Tax=Apostasia shenzhenica TaxID=1088818 RepID=A0A2I0AB24_9ASPA|nr:hypothetical protein AXF42_Ash001696 [Apostasia shenzhenica]
MAAGEEGSESLKYQVRSSSFPYLGFEGFDPLRRMQEESEEGAAGHGGSLFYSSPLPNLGGFGGFVAGVYKTTIDSQLQKVTVTGNVDADVLIKKLLKTGKHAELWPEKKPAAQNPVAGSPGAGKKNKKKGGTANAGESEGNQEKTQLASEGDENFTSSKPAAAGDEGQKPSQGAAASGGGGKTKGKKGSANSGESVLEEAAGKQQVSPPIQLPAPAPAPAYHFPTYPTQAPAYVVSYNTVQPAASYGGAAFYPVAMHQNSYLYSGHQPAAGSYYIPAAASSPGNCDLFSEENANSCSVM